MKMVHKRAHFFFCMVRMDPIIPPAYFFTWTGQSSSQDAGSTDKNEISSHRILSLWKHAVESSKALLLDETMLSPDALLEKVEEFEGTTQAAEHSYTALISSSEAEADILVGAEEEAKVRTSDGDYDNDATDSFGFLESSAPFGSLPVDLLAKHLNPE